MVILPLFSEHFVSVVVLSSCCVLEVFLCLSRLCLFSGYFVFLLAVCVRK